MMKDAFAHYTFIGASCIALFSFLLVFIGSFLWVFRKGSVETYRYTSSIPLRDEEEVHHE